MENAVEIAPYVFMFDNFIDNSQEIIDNAMKRKDDGFLYDAKIGKGGSEENFSVDKTVRDTTIIDISPTYSNEVEWWILAQKLWKQGDEYGKYVNVGFSEMEYPQFLFYPKNQGFYNSHVDTGTSIPRIFSSVLYLNDVESGGETYFEKFDIEVKPLAGRLLMFPSNFVYKHGARVPISNDKYCVVTWFDQII